MLPSSSFGAWHTPPLAGVGPAGVCGVGGGGPTTGRPRARPLPPRQDTQKIHEAAPTLVQTCAESHAWRHAPRSMRTRGPTAWPGVRRHLLPCALLDGLEEGRHVEHPPQPRLPPQAGTTAPPRTCLLTLGDTHARTLTQHPFLRQPHLDHAHTRPEHTPPRFLISHLFDAPAGTPTTLLVRGPPTGTPPCSFTHAGHTRGHTLGCLRQAGRPAARAPGARMPPADGYLPAHQRADLRW